MSAQGYFQGSSQPQQQQQYRPYGGGHGHIDYESQSRPGMSAPAYSFTTPSFDERPQQAQNPYQHQQQYASQPPSQDAPYNPYASTAIHKPQETINTSQNEWPPTQYTGYPPSPESQQPHDQVPQSKSKKRRRKKKQGFFAGKVPWFCYGISLVQLTVFIVEIIKNSIITGSPIMTKPSFNPMIGPSVYVLINMGARFVPCMRTTYFPGTKTPYPDTPWPCPNTTSNLSNDPNNQCHLGELCGMGSFNYNSPDQWWRFITPMFLHAGIIHIGFNLLLQLTLGRDMEKTIGTLRFVIVYLSSGIFGFVLGGNFAAPAIASTGSSGALFGIFALVILDLFYNWGSRESPVKDLCFLCLDIAISFVLGLLPGLDNFSHIGGLLMGLVLGMVLLHSPEALRRRIDKGHKSSYSQIGSDADIPMASGAIKDDTPPTRKDDTPPARINQATALSKFAKEPVGFFKGSKPAWWAWWLIRAGCLIGVLVAFIVLLTNFYADRKECSWCKYLSCLDITVGGQNWCELGYMTFPNTTGTKRGLNVFTVEDGLQL